MLKPVVLGVFSLLLPKHTSKRQPASAARPPSLEPLEPRSLLSAAHPVKAPSTHLLDSAPTQIHLSTPKKSAAKKVTAPAKLKKAKSVAYEPPITITSGGVYSGNWRSLNPNVPAVRIRTSEPVTITNSVIVSRSTLIDAFDCDANLTVTNTSGYALNPNVYGQFPGRFMDIDGFSRITAYNNYMEGTSGIYLYNYLGNHTASQSVRISYNSAKNIDGRFSNGNNGFLTGSDDNYFVQFFQINGVHDLPGIEIAWNQVINDPGHSRVEESINIHDSSGTPTSPILIHDNYIQGAYPANPKNPDGYTGGGIMLSDNGSSHTRAYNNQIISTSHEGITISSGHDNQIFNNRIISSGYLPNGRPNPSQNVGVVIWNYNDEPDFADNTGYRNLIGWMCDGSQNNSFIPDAAYWAKNKSYPGKVTKKVEANEWTLWQKKLAKAQITVGPTTP